MTPTPEGLCTKCGTEPCAEHAPSTPGAQEPTLPEGRSFMHAYGCPANIGKPRGVCTCKTALPSPLPGVPAVDLEPIKAREQAATGGPWHQGPSLSDRRGIAVWPDR